MKSSSLLLLLSLTVYACAQAPSSKEVDAVYPSAHDLYIDLHKNPELSSHETQTAAKLATRLRSLGYEADLCLTDFGATAERVVEDKLRAKAYDCVLIGAGIRVIPSSFMLFEKLINVVHANAPQAKLCFNTKPSDTAEAVLRWV